jgi:iron complex transport system substrate-binding protein
MNKRLIAALLLLVFLVIFPCESGFSGDTPKNQIIKTVDFKGRTLSLKVPARRIVCLIESALSGLYMLGAQESVIGVSANIYNGSVFPYYSAMDARIKDHELPAPGNWDFVSMESLIALSPDLVIIWGSQTEVITNLEKKGINVYTVEMSSFEDIYKEIQDLGALTGKSARADELIKYSKDQLALLKIRSNAIPADKRPGVYFMWAQGDLETSGEPSTVNDLIALAGARNICGHIKQEHTVINLENLLTWNPDVIVMWFNEKKSPDNIIKQPAWRNITAVRDKRVYELPSVFFCDLWTLKCIHAVRLMSLWCFPEKNIQTNLSREKKEMLKKLYGPEMGGKIPLHE